MEELDRFERSTGGSKHVLYSITPEMKKQAQLRIMRTDPNNQLFKQIFTNLFLRGMVEGQSFGTDNLDGLLEEISATREDLIIESIEEDYLDYVEGQECGNIPEKLLPHVTCIRYRPISHISIVENISYRQNIFYHFCKEDTVYNFTIPGMSINNFTNAYYTFRVKPKDAEQAFIMAARNGLIRPIMVFRNDTIFAFADDALNGS
jgi:hypothetical protein